MMKRMSSTEAARQFRNLMRAAQRETILIEQRGQPRLVVMSIHAYTQLTRFAGPVVGATATASAASAPAVKPRASPKR